MYIMLVSAAVYVYDASSHVESIIWDQHVACNLLACTFLGMLHDHYSQIALDGSTNQLASFLSRVAESLKGCLVFLFLLCPP
jgi:hypothetical protein